VNIVTGGKEAAAGWLGRWLLFDIIFRLVVVAVVAVVASSQSR
jgi:hypothetical protein